MLVDLRYSTRLNCCRNGASIHAKENGKEKAPQDAKIMLTCWIILSILIITIAKDCDLLRYSLEVTAKDTKFLLNLSQPDLRYTLKAPPPWNKDYDSFGLYILKAESTTFRKFTYPRTHSFLCAFFVDF